MTNILMKETEPTEEELKENSIAEKYSNRNFKVHQTQQQNGDERRKSQ